MIHSISSADNASRLCLSPRPIAAKKSFTTWTFFCVLIGFLHFPYIGSRSVGASANIDVQGDVEGAGAVFGQADHHQAERLERLGHLQAADIQRAQPETLEESRDARLGLRIVGCDE